MGPKQVVPYFPTPLNNVEIHLMNSSGLTYAQFDQMFGLTGLGIPIPSGWENAVPNPYPNFPNPHTLRELVIAIGLTPP
jgi:hypothetical protein